MALPALSPEQRQAALQKAREARAARSALLAGLKAGTLTLADVLGRDDDLARKTKVAQVVRALPGVGQARAAAVMERAGIPAERRIGGLGARQREQPLAEFPGGCPRPALDAIRGGVPAEGPPAPSTPSRAARRPAPLPPPSTPPIPPPLARTPP